jgi:hypothetical protein
MKKGLYAEALNLYKEIESSDPFWANKITANIALAYKKIEQEKKPEITKKTTAPNSENESENNTHPKNQASTY